MDLVQRVNAELMQESDYYSSCAIADKDCSNDKAKVEEFFEWTKAFENETPSSFIDNELELDVSGEVIDVDLTTMEEKKIDHDRLFAEQTLWSDIAKSGSSDSDMSA